MTDREKIAVITSGGDAPGMNACIRAIVRTALKKNLAMLGYRRGYQGLIADDFVTLGRFDVSNIIQTGGSILISSRSDEFMTRDGRQKAADNLAKHGVGGLIVIGGNGSLTGAHLMSQETGIKVIGIPGTIDRDIYGTEQTIGFDTAVNTALDAIDRIRDTASAMERVFIIEVMGRDSGDIALYAGVAGGADAVLVPEISTDIDELIGEIRAGFEVGKKTNLIVVAEGDDCGGAMELSEKLKNKGDIRSWVCILGHIQRGGRPTARDRYYATAFGVAAVEALADGISGVMIGWDKGGGINHVPLTKTYSNKKVYNEEIRKLLEAVA
jgi:6-phosphofructokinase 1